MTLRAGRTLLSFTRTPTLQPVAVVGDDAERFATIRKILGDSVTAVPVDDQDGPAALGWVNGSSLGLVPNPVASALVDRPICGPMVMTGLGHGDAESTSSIHSELQRVLEQMARDELHRHDD
jgi:hypothetical protein